MYASGDIFYHFLLRAKSSKNCIQYDCGFEQKFIVLTNCYKITTLKNTVPDFCYGWLVLTLH